MSYLTSWTSCMPPISSSASRSSPCRTGPRPRRACENSSSSGSIAWTPTTFRVDIEEHGLDVLPLWNWEDDAWTIGFWAFPKKVGARGRFGVRRVGLWDHPVVVVDARRGIVSALRSKATRYGELDLPFVVAVNTLHLAADTEDAAAALFGSLQLLFNPATGQSREARAPDGAWGTSAAPRSRGVSAALLVLGATPWTCGVTDPGLWHVHALRLEPAATIGNKSFAWPSDVRIGR